MIDLHVHTTASDGRATPGDLVARAARAGIAVLAVTDHDTVAALPEAAAHASRAGIRFVPGIEISAMWEGRDVHVLGYFLDPAAPALSAFLAGQRADRIRRARAIAARLAALGASIDVDALLAAAAANPERSIGRPQIARALVASGQVASTAEAFERFLAEGAAAYVPREAPAPAEVVAIVAAAGGLASLAHPGVLGRDDLIPALARAGLAALEAYHPDHRADQVAHYRAMATRFDLETTGGSDYHADAAYGAPELGVIGLPPTAFARLTARAETGHAAGGRPSSPPAAANGASRNRS